MSDLGANINKYRQSKKFTLKELAEIVQVSSSFLSQVEHGKNEPSLSTLKKIADALGCTVSELLGEKNPNGSRVLIRVNERQFINTHSEVGLTIMKLSEFNPINEMEVCVHQLEPLASSGRNSYSHKGQEIFYVLKGNINLSIGDFNYSMSEGDCYYLQNCLLAHRFNNISKIEGASVMCISTPPFFYSKENMDFHNLIK